MAITSDGIAPSIRVEDFIAVTRRHRNTWSEFAPCSAMCYIALQMGSQVTVRLSDELKKSLDAASDRLHLKTSEVVRLALKEFLRSYGPNARPADRVRGLIGSLESGMPDMAENHRRYILESLKNGE